MMKFNWYPRLTFGGMFIFSLILATILLVQMGIADYSQEWAKIWEGNCKFSSWTSTTNSNGVNLIANCNGDEHELYSHKEILNYLQNSQIYCKKFRGSLLENYSYECKGVEEK